MKIQQFDQLQSFTNVTAHVRNDLVFENRFKEYGAYQIRKNYTATILWAMLFAFGTVSLAIIGSKLLFLNSKTEILQSLIPDNGLTFIETEIDLTPKEIIPVVNTEPLKAEIMKSEKFTTNISVVDDKQIATDVKAQDDLSKTTISVITQDGKIGEDIKIIEDPAGNNTDLSNSVKTFLSVEEMPFFVGGDEALFKYLEKNTNYPEISKNLKIMGKVYVQFVIGPDGTVQKAVIARGVRGGKELELEALRVVKNMPKWTPGKQNGVPVFVQFTLPVNFVLQ